MNLENLEPYIHSRLTSLLGGPLPYQGIFAGSGMATILLSILWDRNIPTESLDLYADWPNEPLEGNELSYSSIPSLNDEIYPPLLHNEIRFISSEPTGILNRHIIEKQLPVFGKDRTLLILYALELNAFGVGYDSYSHKIHVTNEFKEFCYSRQLRIQSPVRAESLLMLLKFRQVLNCYADIGEEISLLTGFRRSCNLREDTNVYNDIISVGGKKIYDQFRMDIEPFCSIVAESDQPILPGLEDSLKLRYRLTFKNGQESTPKYMEVDQLLKATEINFDSYIFAVYYKYCVRRSTSNSLMRRFMLALSHSITACMAILNPGCLEHNFTVKHVLTIDDFYKMHPGCVRMLFGLNLTILSMSSAILEIRAFAKKNGNQIIGLIETHNRIGYSLEEISRESLEQLLETYRNNAGTPLLESAANLDAFEYRDFVTELTTTTELECEGWRMRNCVGGYAPVLSSDQGNTRIFHIDGAQPSTAAIYFKREAGSDELTYEVYGVANGDPAQEHVLITEHLGRYLSKTLWNEVEHNVEGDSQSYVY